MLPIDHSSEHSAVVAAPTKPVSSVSTVSTTQEVTDPSSADNSWTKRDSTLGISEDPYAGLNLGEYGQQWIKDYETFMGVPSIIQTTTTTTTTSTLIVSNPPSTDATAKTLSEGQAKTETPTTTTAKVEPKADAKP